jgi:hypothetical protein
MELARTNMGYYSDVVYAIKFEKDAEYLDEISDEVKTYSGKGVFQIFLTEAKANKDTEECFDDDGDFKIDNENLTISYRADGVKWYEGNFSDVDCHVNLMNLADEYIELHYKAGHMRISPIAWGFARIGEDTGDDEIRHGGDWGYELVEINRSVNLNV